MKERPTFRSKARRNRRTPLPPSVAAGNGGGGQLRETSRGSSRTVLTVMIEDTAGSTQSIGLRVQGRPTRLPVCRASATAYDPLNCKLDASSRFAVQVRVVARRATQVCLHLDLGSAFRRSNPDVCAIHAARVLLAITAPS